MPHATILVVGDEQLVRRLLSRRVQSQGYDVFEAGTGADALVHARQGVDLVLLDYKLPDLDGVQLLSRLKELDPDILVILVTAHVSVDTAVTAMKLGAYHVANKPFDLAAITAIVEQALEANAMRREMRRLRATQAQPCSLDGVIGGSLSVRRWSAAAGTIAKRLLCSASTAIRSATASTSSASRTIRPLRIRWRTNAQNSTQAASSAPPPAPVLRPKA